MAKILVTGTTGFVGKKIYEYLPDTVASPSLRGMSEKNIKNMIDSINPDVIIHTAAISDIGDCEKDPEASEYANILIPVFIAKASAGRKLICFSSDQVYSGCDEKGPYSEETVKGANVYANHKIEMEKRVLEICPDAVMLRAEWMYDYKSYKGNYFLNMLNTEGEMRCSSSQFRGLTYLKEVAENMEKVILLPGGAYNFGSETEKSIYEISKEFASYMNLDIKISDDAPRHNLWMNCDKARKYGVVFSSVEDGLKRCAEDYAKELG